MKKEWKIFYIALIIHATYALIIINTQNQVSAYCVKDQGQILDLAIQYNHDTKSYVESADNFLEFGVFGQELKADHHRTIGYPLILAFVKSLFGKYWFYALFAIQFLLSLLIYPFSFLAAKILFDINVKVLYYASVLTILLGAYFQRPFYILSDLSFTFFFLLGLFYSIYGLVKEKQLLNWIAVLLLIFASLIRPVLMLYPIAHFFILLFVSKKYNVWKSRKTLVISSTIVLILGCNLSSFNNYYHYKVFVPTDILGYVMLEYSTKHILQYDGKNEEYLQLKKLADEQKDWIARDKFRKKAFFQTVKDHPISALKYWMGRGAKIHLLYPHYMKIGEIYGYFNRDKDRNGRPMIESNFMKIILYSFSLINVLIIFLSSLYLFNKLIFERNVLFFLAFGLLFIALLGPSFIAASSARFRIPVEPFLISLSLAYIYEKRTLLYRLFSSSGKKQK